MIRKAYSLTGTASNFVVECFSRQAAINGQIIYVHLRYFSSSIHFLFITCSMDSRHIAQTRTYSSKSYSINSSRTKIDGPFSSINYPSQVPLRAVFQSIYTEFIFTYADTTACHWIELNGETGARLVS